MALERHDVQSKGDMFRAASTMIDTKVRDRTRKLQMREIAAWVAFAVAIMSFVVKEGVRIARDVEAEAEVAPPITIPVEVPVPSQDAAALERMAAELAAMRAKLDEPEPEPAPKSKGRR